MGSMVFFRQSDIHQVVYQSGDLLFMLVHSLEHADDRFPLRQRSVDCFDQHPAVTFDHVIEHLHAM